nr:C-type lectin domain family 2 member D-like isoform X2 [Chrysemys picta bellii]XP_042702035.1 C-type lectin domain family 2 member D-like isoform X2 [Chrysemys picta bellii]
MLKNQRGAEKIHENDCRLEKRPHGGNTAVSLLIVQKMAEESDEATSDTNFSLKCVKDKWIPVTVTVVITALIITIIALAAKKTPPCPSCPSHVTAACPGGWVGYQGKCYYFSETEGNWNNSQSHCSSLNSSLASIDSLPALDFMLRYKGIPYHWIGLHREQGEGQPWKWTNGTIFNNLFQVRGEGQCAYLDEQGVSSSRCYSERHFICRWPDSAPTSPPRICTAASSLPPPPQSVGRSPAPIYHHQAVIG